LVEMVLIRADHHRVTFQEVAEVGAWIQIPKVSEGAPPVGGARATVEGQTDRLRKRLEETSGVVVGYDHGSPAPGS
jgi:hypothetical protein